MAGSRAASERFVPEKPDMSSNAAASGPKGQALEPLEALGQSRLAACVRLDADGRIVAANSLCREWLTGDPAGGLDGRSFVEWLGQSANVESFREAARAGEPRSLSFALRSAGGESMTLQAELIPDADTRGLLGIFFRLSDQTFAMPARMERSARLEALGSLTSGVAHDFNNLLTILIGNLSLVAEDLRGDERMFGKLKAARDAARRGSELIKQLLSFARQEPVASKPIDPAAVIGRIAPLIERALGKRIAFELDLDAAAGSIQGNSAQLESVIVNLAVNARDAIEAKGAVTIRVGTTAERSRRNVFIEVADDGSGIPSEVVDRVFEPFYTTKPEGKGSGLGLSMVKAYTEQFGGKLSLKTGAGEGTTVRLAFPGIREVAEDSAAMTMPIAALPAGRERVLILTHDESLAAMIEQVLSVLGYSCQNASDPAAAATMLRRDKPELVICDGIDSGWPLAAQSDPDQARCGVLWLSSIAESAGTSRGAVLHKPFSLPDLAVAVRSSLDALV